MNPRSVNVLLVEDNPVDVEAVRRAFRKHRIANPITVAHDGLDALEILRGTHSEKLERPYLILLDLNMPRMNGIEFLQAIRDDTDLKDSVVFVLTTSRAQEDKLASYSLNAAGYIVKSDVGKGFQGLVNLLDCYWRIVELPPQRTS